MTPTALTPAARKAAAQRAAEAAVEAGHPRRLRRTAGAPAPRRVSGPVSRGGQAPPARRASAAIPSPVAAPTAPPRPARPARPAAPARPATPARPARPAAPRPRRSRAATGPKSLRLGPLLGRATALRLRPSGRGLLALLSGVPDHHLLDRLVRGRAWIPVLGVMLTGIVFMQVEVLKLGAGIGRAMQQTTTLTTGNESLRIDVAKLGDDQRIESLAARMGLIMPAPTAVGFLGAGTAGAQPALKNLSAPDPNLFLSASSNANGAVAGIITPGSAPVTPVAAALATTASVSGAPAAGSATTPAAPATGSTAASSAQAPVAGPVASPATPGAGGSSPAAGTSTASAAPSGTATGASPSPAASGTSAVAGGTGGAGIGAPGNASTGG